MHFSAVNSAVNSTVTTPAQRSGHQFLRSRRPALTREAPSRGGLLYAQALQLARLQDQEEAARMAFEECCRADPDNTKVRHLHTMAAAPFVSLQNASHSQFLQAWVSWAQFEKRVNKGDQDRFQTCRQVLQQGLTLNRTSAALIQVHLAASNSFCFICTPLVL